MSFLSIPSQDGYFTTIKTGKLSEEAESKSPMDDQDKDDDDEDDEDDTDVRLIPRCSPVPRKRGHSIHDETAEYMRIQLALPAGKRVLFADTTGGDLVDVKEFVAFESDDEEDCARWEEEEAKYRKPEREPSYHVQPEFNAPVGDALLRAVRSTKVEVEQMCPVEDEPLAITGLVRVLNVSFHKAVYIRATMDHWATHFDHPAEYVPESNDGDTDQFSFKLSFAPPYTTHGSRIEFVVRYETSDGDFWANNASMNYAVTLLLSYEDDSSQANNNIQQARGILKPPKCYSMDDDFASEEEEERDEEEAGASKSGLVRPVPVCPVIVQPEIDIEIAAHPSGPCVPPNQELPSVDGTPSVHTVSPGEQFAYMSSESTLQTNSPFVLCASESVQPNKSRPLPRLHCELGNQTSEQPIESSPFALPMAPPPPRQHESRPRSDSSRAGGEKIPPSEEIPLTQAPFEQLPTAETSLWPTTREDGSTGSRPRLELPTECVSAPGVTRGFDREVEVGLSELAGLSEGSSRSAADPEGSTPALSSPEAESEASLEAEGEAPPPPELTETTGQNSALPSAPQISPDAFLFENPPNTPEVYEFQSERDAGRNLIPSIIFLSGVVSLSIVLQEPSALFIIGLLLVLHRL